MKKIYIFSIILFLLAAGILIYKYFPGIKDLPNKEITIINEGSGLKNLENKNTPQISLTRIDSSYNLPIPDVQIKFNQFNEVSGENKKLDDIFLKIRPLLVNSTWIEIITSGQNIYILKEEGTPGPGGGYVETFASLYYFDGSTIHELFQDLNYTDFGLFNLNFNPNEVKVYSNSREKVFPELMGFYPDGKGNLYFFDPNSLNFYVVNKTDIVGRIDCKNKCAINRNFGDSYLMYTDNNQTTYIGIYPQTSYPRPLKDLLEIGALFRVNK